MRRLGKCCGCEMEGIAVRNIVFVTLRSPEPGAGCWGCITCGLEPAGAIAVLCDNCVVVMEHEGGYPKWVCVGPPPQNRRVLTESLHEAFDHDHRLHTDEWVATQLDWPLLPVN